MKWSNQSFDTKAWSLTGAAWLFVTAVGAWGGTPLEPAFTYQGLLELDGAAVNDTCDFEFRLYEDAGGVTQIGSTQTILGVVVTDGVFSVELNGAGQFSPDAFNGEKRWLQIAVRCPPDPSFTALAPLQPITAVPYALQTRGLFVDGAGSVGIGTTDPRFAMTVRGTGVNSDSIQFQTSDGTNKWHLSQTAGGLDFVETGIAANRLYLRPGGNVGIGTPSPVAVLHVRGRGQTTILNAELSNGDTAFNVQQNGNVAFNGNVAIFGSHNLSVGGNLSVTGSKNFIVDHPLDPANKSLAHNAVEGPGYYTLYRGNVVLDARGEAWVEVPAYFDALNTQPTYQLTCVGGYAPVYVAEAIRDNRFKIAGGREGLTVSWQVTGLRNDPYARDHPYQDVIEKEAAECGRYHYPAGYGMPEEMSTSRNPAEAVGSMAAAERGGALPRRVK